MQITRYCGNARENGYLTIVKEHSFVRRHAEEYQFVVGRFPSLMKTLVLMQLHTTKLVDAHQRSVLTPHGKTEVEL